MKGELNFYKNDLGEWHVDLPDYPGSTSDLQMVLNADVFCESLSKGSNVLKLLFDQQPFQYYDGSNYDGVIKLVELVDSDDNMMGAWYKATSTNNNGQMYFWLCSVMYYIFGTYPPELYFKVVSTNHSLAYPEDELKMYHQMKDAFNDEKFIWNCVVSFNHAAGLLSGFEQQELRMECKEWMRSILNNWLHRDKK